MELSIFGVSLLLWTDPSPTGIAISVVICVVAALNLFIDFAVIDQGVTNGAPSFMEWYSAWGTCCYDAEDILEALLPSCSGPSAELNPDAPRGEM